MRSRNLLQSLTGAILACFLLSACGGSADTSDSDMVDEGSANEDATATDDEFPHFVDGANDYTTADGNVPEPYIGLFPVEQLKALSPHALHTLHALHYPRLAFNCSFDSKAVTASFVPFDIEDWWEFERKIDMKYSTAYGQEFPEKWFMTDLLFPSTNAGQFIFNTALAAESLEVEMNVGWDTRELRFNTLAAREALQSFKSKCPYL